MANDSTSSSSNRICVTCGRWGGARDTGQFIRPTIVRFDIHTKGKCIGGGFVNAAMGPTATCNRWIKWPVLV